jgi:hypothetical protein
MEVSSWENIGKYGNISEKWWIFNRNMDLFKVMNFTFPVRNTP